MKKAIKLVLYGLVIALLLALIWYFPLRAPSVTPRQAIGRAEKARLMTPGQLLFFRDFDDDPPTRLYAGQKDGWLRLVFLRWEDLGWRLASDILSLPLESPLTVGFFPWSSHNEDTMVGITDLPAARAVGTLTVTGVDVLWQHDFDAAVSTEGDFVVLMEYSSPSDAPTDAFYEWEEWQKAGGAWKPFWHIALEVTLYDSQGAALEHITLEYPR